MWLNIISKHFLCDKQHHVLNFLSNNNKLLNYYYIGFDVKLIPKTTFSFKIHIRKFIVYIPGRKS